MAAKSIIAKKHHQTVQAAPAEKVFKATATPTIPDPVPSIQLQKEHH
jgi:hypothetical protein